VVTSSFQLTHQLLEEGPFLTLLPTYVLPSLTKTLSLQILPVLLPHQSEPVGIVKLRNRKLSPVAEIFIEAARAVARSIPSKPNEFVGMPD
jgi:DNA-binding transcriptional LysR family regulator